jgi:dipeptidase E
MKNLIVASTSTVHGESYLEYLLNTLVNLYQGTEEVVFVPYARPGGISHDDYSSKASETFSKINKRIRGIHTFDNPQKAIRDAKGIFTGGGNTFVLVNALHRLQLMEPLRKVIFGGTPYLGTSAGSNICGISMQTTNDMPIIYPPSFKTLGILPFNINPHYIDPDPSSTHMGETRETRIKEFQAQNSIPVIGLREGSWLDVRGENVVLKGDHSARIFLQNKEPFEIDSGTVIDKLQA